MPPQKRVKTEDDGILSLPDVVLRFIFDFLNKSSLLQATVVCKAFKRLATDSRLCAWKWFVFDPDVYYDDYYYSAFQGSESENRLYYESPTDCLRRVMSRFQSSKYAILQLNLIQPSDVPTLLELFPNTLEFLCLDMRRRFESRTQAQLSQIALQLIRKQTNLKELVLCHCQTAASTFISTLSNLTSLCLLHSVLTPTCMKMLPTWCPLLMDLIAFETSPVEDDQTDDQGQHTSVDDDDKSPFYSNEDLNAILKGLPSLRRLEIGGASCNSCWIHVNEHAFSGVQELVNLNLKEVCIGRLNSFDDEALSALVTYAPNIEKLIIEGSPIQSKALLLQQLKRLPNLRDLNIVGLGYSTHTKIMMFDLSDVPSLASSIPSIQRLRLMVEDCIPKARMRKKFKQYATNLLNPIEVCFESRTRVMKAGRNHCWLSWFDHRKENSSDHAIESDRNDPHPSLAITSEQEPLNSLRDLIEGTVFSNPLLVKIDGKYFTDEDYDAGTYVVL